MAVVVNSTCIMTSVATRTIASIKRNLDRGQKEIMNKRLNDHESQDSRGLPRSRYRAVIEDTSTS